MSYFIQFYRNTYKKIGFIKPCYVYFKIYLASVKLGLNTKELLGVYLALEVMINKIEK